MEVRGRVRNDVRVTERSRSTMENGVKDKELRHQKDSPVRETPQIASQKRLLRFIVEWLPHGTL